MTSGDEVDELGWNLEPPVELPRSRAFEGESAGRRSLGGRIEGLCRSVVTLYSLARMVGHRPSVRMEVQGMHA